MKNTLIKPAINFSKISGSLILAGILATNFGILNSAQAQTGTSSIATPANLSEGVIRKIDKEAQKITLKHGEIKSMEMPAMSMVFHVKDAALLENFKPGDKVMFQADRAEGALWVTQMELQK